MTPTQAQIDAADRIWHWLKRNANAEQNDDKRAAFIEAANAALKIVEEAKAALTAAAEVGTGPLGEALSAHQANWYYDEMEKVRAATVERCAQLVSEWRPFIKERNNLIAAIRALKDKP